MDFEIFAPVGAVSLDGIVVTIAGNFALDAWIVVKRYGLWSLD